jgi:hypothetical protein
MSLQPGPPRSCVMVQARICQMAPAKAVHRTTFAPVIRGTVYFTSLPVDGCGVCVNWEWGLHLPVVASYFTHPEYLFPFFHH